MKKFLIVATIFALMTQLAMSAINPDSSLLLLSATNEEYMYVRAALVLILGSLLLYKPPRSIAFRFGLVGMALLTASATLMLIVNNSLQPFDALLFMEVTILLAIEAAELGVHKESKKEKTIPSTRRSRHIYVQTV